MSDGKTLTLMVIDDSQADAILLGRQLKKIEGLTHELIACTSADQALKELQNRSIDCIFLDHRLGAVSGIDVLKQIRQCTDTPVIALTGQIDTKTEKQALQFGAQEYLTKDDANPQSLARALRSGIREVQLRRKLATVEHEFKQFVYAASHDLKAPVRRVATFAQILGEELGDDLDDEKKSYLKFIDDNSKKAMDLIELMTELSRAGRDETRKDEFPLKPFVHSVKETLGELIEKTKATVQVECHGQVYAKSQSLVRLFQQALRNALLYHGPDANPEVSIWNEQSDGYTKVFIRDNGIGIDPSHHEQVFEAFFRLHTEEEYPGAGLGLAICRKVVEDHDGKMGLESTPGEGTTLWFALPHKPAETGEK